MIIIMMIMIMLMIMTIVSVEQRPGWGEHVILLIKKIVSTGMRVSPSPGRWKALQNSTVGYREMGIKFEKSLRWLPGHIGRRLG